MRVSSMVLIFGLAILLHAPPAKANGVTDPGSPLAAGGVLQAPSRLEEDVGTADPGNPGSPDDRTLGGHELDLGSGDTGLIQPGVLVLLESVTVPADPVNSVWSDVLWWHDVEEVRGTNVVIHSRVTHWSDTEFFDASGVPHPESEWTAAIRTKVEGLSGLPAAAFLYRPEVLTKVFGEGEKQPIVYNAVGPGGTNTYYIFSDPVEVPPVPLPPAALLGSGLLVALGVVRRVVRR